MAVGIKKASFAVAAGLAVISAVGSTRAGVDFGAYSGPITIKLTNYDVGTLYPQGATGTSVTGSSNVDAIAGQTPPPQSSIGGDSWGIFRITTITEDTTGHTAYSYDSNNTTQHEFVGIFWGETDNTVTFVSPTEQDISGTGLKIAVYEVANDSANPNGLFNGGPSLLSGTATSPVYPTVSLGAPVFTLSTVPGANPGRSLTDTFFTQFNPNNDTIIGAGTAYADVGTLGVGTGSQNDVFQKNPTGDLIFPHDVSLQFTSIAGPDVATTHGWLVESQDPVTGSIVPEPATIGVMAVGAMGLMARRRRA